MNGKTKTMERELNFNFAFKKHTQNRLGCVCRQHAAVFAQAISEAAKGKRKSTRN